MRTAEMEKHEFLGPDRWLLASAVIHLAMTPPNSIHRICD